jgi:sugar phosphate isomerase/epimerase
MTGAIGLSTSYFAMRGYSIYDSVAAVAGMGFKAVELGAAHAYEDDALEALGRVKRDFPWLDFTVHTLFPPLPRRVWFNPADGLTLENRRIVDGLFDAAAVVGARIVSIHPAVFSEVIIGDRVTGNFYGPKVGDAKNPEKGKRGFLEVLGIVYEMARGCGVDVLIENIDMMFSRMYPSSAREFLEVFDMLPGVGMLLDVGHALDRENLDEMLDLGGHIRQVHLHDVGYIPEGGRRAHFPIRGNEFFEPLKILRENDSIMFVFEHGVDVLEEEIMLEKEMLENFIAGR